MREAVSASEVNAPLLLRSVSHCGLTRCDNSWKELA